MLRAVRIVVAGTCFAVGLALIALMVRSYAWCDAVIFEPVSYTSYMARSIEGSFLLRRTYNPMGCSNSTWRGSSRQLSTIQSLDEYRKQSASPSHLGARSSTFHSSYWIDVPHWFAAIMASLPGVVLLRGRAVQFSLRSVLLVTTATAAVLGLVVSF